MPVDHFSLTVPAAKLDDVVNWLTRAMGHMDFKEVMRPLPRLVGMGETSPYLWIAGMDVDGLTKEAHATQMKYTHVAFTAKDIKQVKDFYAVAIEAGGVDNGKPGRRPHYHVGYYAAFVRDPFCGINFEVVFHGCPEDKETLERMEEDAET